MGTVLAVVYAADTIVAYKYYRDSGDWLLLLSPPLASIIMIVGVILSLI